MTILSDRLSHLMQQRSEWLSKRAQTITENIANADMPRARRKDVTPFSEVLHRAPLARTSTGKRLRDIKAAKTTSNDIHTTVDEISREQEMMMLTRSTADHDGLMNVIKSFHKMYRSILNKG